MLATGARTQTVEYHAIHKGALQHHIKPVSLAGRRPVVDTQPVREWQNLGNTLADDATNQCRNLLYPWGSPRYSGPIYKAERSPGTAARPPPIASEIQWHRSMSENPLDRLDRRKHPAQSMRLGQQPLRHLHSYPSPLNKEGPSRSNRPLQAKVDQLPPLQWRRS